MFLIEILPKNRPLGMSKRDFGLAMKQMYFALAQHWKEKYLPLHFKTAGARKYKYAKRAGHNLGRYTRLGRRSYLTMKMEKHQGTIGPPLVYSGRSRTTATRDSKVRATRHWGRVAIKAPALNFRTKRTRGVGKGTAIDMGDEVTRTTKTEVQEMGRFASRFLRRKLKEFKESK